MAADGRPPEVSSEATAALITKYFPFKHVSLVSLKTLPSYDDRNIYFSGVLEEEGGQCGGERPFVLKLFNCITTNVDILHGITAIMQHLSERCFPNCCPIASRRGDYVISLSDSEMYGVGREGPRSGVRYPVRVLTFLPGEVMDKLEKRFMTPELSFSVGDLVGRMNLALQVSWSVYRVLLQRKSSLLQNFSHPAIDKRRNEDWDLQYFLADIQKYIPHVQDEKKRHVADSVVAMYEKHIVPLMPSMKKGVIHGDVNGLNIIFNPTAESCEMVGLIDFGDFTHSCYLFELAIMVAYAQLEKENPVEFVAPMIQGYLEVFPLSKEELGCLYYAVLARLCQSAVNGEYRFTQEPWNTYLLTTPALAWEMMDLLLALTRERVEEIWKI